MKHAIAINTKMLNDYQIGRISGIVYCLSGMPEKEFGHTVDTSTDTRVIHYLCDEEQHKNIVDTIERKYPGVIKGSY